MHEENYNELKMADWVGLLIGALIGFLLSELRLIISSYRTKERLRKHFSQYEGTYAVATKGGHKPNLHEVCIKHFKSNVLDIKFKTVKSNSAQGKMIMDYSTLMFGKAFYRHFDTEFKNQSGFYDIIFCEPGVIHAKLSYIKGTTREEITEFYIWTKR